MALSAILHWLVSQSIFLVAVDVYDWDGAPQVSKPWAAPYSYQDYIPQGDWKSCGYSPIAIFTVIILGVLMVVTMIGFRFVPLKGGMNFAGSCSVAISAAC